ncbi:MAG: DNA gyrase subunit A, partial [Candidatus Aenigmarchaeota archaeon]|nr:DNA gyrase subunit A [Candidatus Aenigmarchaeota archaeon]
LAIISEETLEIKNKYGDERKTEITDTAYDLSDEDLVPKEDVVVTMTNRGYVKRVPVDEYRMQKRGGKGITATSIGEDGFVKDMFITNSHDYLLFFSNKGRVHWLRTFQLPFGSRYSMGKAIVNFIRLEEGEKISTTIPVKSFDHGKYLIFATKNGVVKKTELDAYSRPRKGGIIAITLRDKDRLIEVKVTDGNRNIFLATDGGHSIKFNEKDVRRTGRSASGVKGIRLRKGDEVIGMEILEDGEHILTVSENGYGKRTESEFYKVQRRAGKGIINMKVTDKTGPVKAIRKVQGGEHIMLISNKGTAIRVEADGISLIGRSTQGVRVMRLKEGDKLEDIELIVENGGEEESD